MFSVIIPLFNKAPYIQRAVESVLKQTFQDFEIIVVNDGSTDGGEKLLEVFNDDRIKIINQVNQGVSNARNTGISHGKFRYISFLDADDYWHKNYLETNRKLIRLYPRVGIIGTGYTSSLFDTSDEFNYSLLNNYFEIAIHNTLYFTSATTINKVFFENNTGFDPGLKLGEDLDVWFRAILYFGNGLYVPDKLVFYGNEDENRATNKKYSFNDTLVAKISKSNYFDDVNIQPTITRNMFELFRDKWLYFNIFPLYLMKSNKSFLEKMVSDLPGRLYMIRIFYLLPFGILNKMFLVNSIANLFRNYMKFCFRYIYNLK